MNWSSWGRTACSSGGLKGIGTSALLTTSAPFPVVNVVAGITLAFLMPYIALTMTYVYSDARIGADMRREWVLHFAALGLPAGE